MTLPLELDLWSVLSALGALMATGLGGIFAILKLLLAQHQRRLDDRFAAQDQARAQGSAALRAAIEDHVEHSRGVASQLASLERDFLQHRADLPLQYVRREDYIRGQTVIEAKLDSLSAKLELMQIKGARND